MPQQAYVTSPEETYAALKSLLSGNPAFRLTFADDVAKHTEFSSTQESWDFAASVVPNPTGGSIVQVESNSVTHEQASPVIAYFFAQLSALLTTGGQTFAPTTVANPPSMHKRFPAVVVAAIVVSALFLLLVLLTIRSTWSVAILIILVIAPVVLVSLSWYVTRSDAKNTPGRIGTYVATGLTVLALIIGGVRVWQGSRSTETEASPESVVCDDFEWPDNDVAKRLPVPDSSKGDVSSESSTGFFISVCDVSKDQYESYVSAAKEKGFTVDYTKGDGWYNAQDADGYSLSLHFDDENGESVMVIDAQAPEAATESETPENTEEPSTSEPPDSSNDDSADFRAGVDEYEQFMNQYVDFMNKYNSSSDPSSMLDEYSEMMTRYASMTQKWSNIDEGSLSADDLNYYLQAQTRIAQKLATVQQ